MDVYGYLNRLELVNEIDGWRERGMSRQYVIDRLLFRYELVQALKWIMLKGDVRMVGDFQRVVKYLMDDEEFLSVEEFGQDGDHTYSAEDIIDELDDLRVEIELPDYWYDGWFDEVVRMFERYRAFIPFAALKSEFALQMSDITKQSGVWSNE